MALAGLRRYIAVVELVSLISLTGCSRTEPPRAPTPTPADIPLAPSESFSPSPSDNRTVLSQIPDPLKPSHIWTLDITGKLGFTLILEESRPLSVRGISPDGRYILLSQRVSAEKGDLTSIVYLLDRTTGDVSPGIQTSIRFARWSGNGFYVDWLVHLDLSMKVTHLEQLAQMLELTNEKREIVSLSFSGDGTHFAALIGQPDQEQPLDLLHGKSDGSSFSVVRGAVKGTTKAGTTATVAMAPDGMFLAIAGSDGAAIIRTSDLIPEQWKWVKASGTNIVWAPDSMHVWFPAGGVRNIRGELIFDPGQIHGLVWKPDGRGGVVYGYRFLRSFQLDGGVADVAIPDYIIPIGFLPDGRLVVCRTITE